MHPQNLLFSLSLSPLLLFACGGSAPASAPTAASTEVASTDAPIVCAPTATLVDFEALQTVEDERPPVHPGDAEQADDESSGIGLSHATPSWTPNGDQILVYLGCDDEEGMGEEGVEPGCDVYIGFSKRQADGTYVASGHKTPDAIHPEMDTYTSVNQAFIADVIGDDALEYWVITGAETEEESPDYKSEKLANVYTIELELLWETKLKTPEEACAWQLYSSDVDCDGDRDLIGKRACEGAAPEEFQFLWTDGALESQK